MAEIYFEKCPVCNGNNLQSELKTKDYSVSKKEFEIHICSACDFGLTQNQPEQYEIGEYYQFEEYVSHSDTKKGIVNYLYHVARNYMLSRKYKLIRKYVSQGRILDIGSGTGYFLNYMQQKKWNVAGIEQEESARDFCKDHFGIEVMSPNELYSHKENSTDVVTMWHVLEHVHDLKGYLKSIQKILSEKGYFILALPNHKSKDAKHYREFWAAYDVPRHIWHFSPKNVKNLISEHGFELLKMRPMPLDSLYISLLSEKHKGSKLGIVNGFVKGFLFFLHTFIKKQGASSIIYVCRKK